MRTSPNRTIEWKAQKELVPYRDSLTWMEERVRAIQNNQALECIWFLEHPPLYTLGTSGQEKDILPSAQLPIFKSGRGGKVTYHGPGQRIVYLMLDLNQRVRDIHKYVFELEEWLINTLAELGVKGERRKGRVGIWVSQKGLDYKIAAIGVRVQKWVTSHGMALNINPNLKDYQNIIPCGIHEHGITSIENLGISVSHDEIDSLLRQTCPFTSCA